MAYRVLVSCQITSACISFAASSTVATMVVRAKKQRKRRGRMQLRRRQEPPSECGNLASCSSNLAIRSSPYHRIILGLSISDILISCGLFTGPFMAPSHVPQALWGRGNNLTCRMNGFLFTFGYTSRSLYMLVLCFFCYCKVARTMTDVNFSKRFEWKLHKLILFLNGIIAVAGLATKSFNSIPGGSFCYIAPSPAGCLESPQLYGECVESIERSATILNVAITFGLISLCLIGITVCMVKICLNTITITQNSIVSSTEKEGTDYQTGMSFWSDEGHSSINLKQFSLRIEGYRIRLVRSKIYDAEKIHKTGNSANFDKEHILEQENNAINRGNNERDQPKSVSAVSDAVNSCKTEIIVQASLYVLAFIATNIFTWIYIAINFCMKQPISQVVKLLGSVLFPLGGLLNILVFTRPKVISLRKQHPEFSRFFAFVRVVRAGGVVPTFLMEEKLSSNWWHDPPLEGNQAVCPTEIPAHVLNINKHRLRSEARFISVGHKFEGVSNAGLPPSSQQGDDSRMCSRSNDDH
jgi:hypothetical protein